MLTFDFTFQPFDLTGCYQMFAEQYNWGWINKIDLANDVKTGFLPVSEFERITGEKYLKTLINNFGFHAVHIVLGLVTSGIGICLISDDHYFFWPPNFIDFINSDCIGTWALFTGLGLIYVAVQKVIPNKANNIWLLSQCAFVGGESFLELMHGLLTHNDHMIAFSIAMFGYLFITFWVIGQNNWLKNKTQQRIKYRDKEIAEGR